MNYQATIAGFIIGIIICLISAIITRYYEEKYFNEKIDWLIMYFKVEMEWATEKKNEYKGVDKDMENMFHGLMRGYENILRVLYNASNKAKDKKD